jgi:C4-dicarboxylate-specific signal transduction histidine kinase
MVAVDLFVSKFNVSQNLTEQQQHVETIMGSEHNERMSMVSQIIGQMSSLDTTYQNMSQHQERFSWTETLNKQLSDSAMQVLFYCLVFMAIFIIFSLIYTNQRERVFERISGLPQQVAAGVEKEVEKRKAYQR